MREPVSVVDVTPDSPDRLSRSVSETLKRLGPMDELIIVHERGHNQSVAMSFGSPQVRYIEVPYHENGLLLGIMLARHEHIESGDGHGHRNDFLGDTKSPTIHLRLTHLGLRPYAQTLRKALISLLESKVSLPHKFWVVLQESDARKDVDRLLDGHDYEIIESPHNRGVAWPKKIVQERLGPNDYLFNLDDDMTVPPGAVDQLYAIASSSADIGFAVLYSPRLQVADLRINSGVAHKEMKALSTPWTEATFTGYGCSMMSPAAISSCRFDDQFFVGGVDFDISLQLRRSRLRTLVYNRMQSSHSPPKSEQYSKIRRDRTFIENGRALLEKRWGLKIPKL